MSDSALPRRILLADCDAYFVQVARLEDPEGAGKERYLIVGGSAQSRGVVTSASYECRRFGIRSGMPMARALRLCPRAVRVGVPRGACSRKHGEIKAVLQRLSPLVEPASIDEFYLDLSGTEGVYAGLSLSDVATRIRLAVLEETKINVSVGGGTSRLVAKLAVRKAKPAGVHVVAPGQELEFMKTLELAAIPGIGPKLQERLRRLGMVSIPDALQHSRLTLEGWLGDGTGGWLYERIRGIDHAHVETGREAKSLSHEETFPRDLHDDASLETELLKLVVAVCGDLRGDGLRARTITVKLKDADFRIRSASRTLTAPVQSDRPVYDIARELLAKLRGKRRTGERLLGVALSHLTAAEGPDQLTLLDASEESPLETARDIALGKALDDARRRFGRGAVVPGRILPPHEA